MSNKTAVWATNPQRPVLLHKADSMKRAQQHPDSRPVQLDLFQTLINQRYSNSVALYQTLPDVFSGKQDRFRNADGSLPVLTRHGIYDQKPYTLDISPANITVSDSITKQKIKKAHYKTVIAEFIEHALHKLSVADGFFTSDGASKPDHFGLITTYYKIREELKLRWKSYSYEQIREGVSILAGLRYELSGDVSKQFGIDAFFSPIDLTIRNDRANPAHSELYITFNKLISKKILALDWRSFNYVEFMKLKTSFGRSLFMRLTHRFTHADSTNDYHFKLSTLVDEWALTEDRITSNIDKIIEGLKDCAYIIDRYVPEPQYEINPETNRRAMSDFKVTVYPTSNFQSEQYRSNSHSKNIRDHRIDEKGQVLIKPMRDQYSDRAEYPQFLNDRESYENAKLSESS